MPWKCRLQNQEYIVWLFAVPGDQYGAVCSLWQGKTKMSSKVLKLAPLPVILQTKIRKIVRLYWYSFLWCYLDSGCSNTLTNCYFVKVFTSYELTMYGLSCWSQQKSFSVETRTMTLAQSNSLRDGVAEKKKTCKKQRSRSRKFLKSKNAKFSILSFVSDFRSQWSASRFLARKNFHAIRFTTSKC